MEYLKKKDLPKLSGKNIEITKVFPAYRSGFNPTTKKGEKLKFVNNEWQLEKWENGERTLTPHKVDYGIHKKVFDIVFKLPERESINISKWNWETKEEEEYVANDNEFTIKEVNASFIKQLAEATVAFGKIPVKDDNTPEYDWEDKFIDKLVGQNIIYSHTMVKKNLNGKDIEYAEFTVKEGKKTNNNVDDDLPF